MKNYSYHDVKVYVDGVVYEPSRNYALKLECLKVSGWRLWNIWKEKYYLIGGEFDSGEFAIEIGEVMVCGKKPKIINNPGPFGWDGVVQR